MYSYIKSCTLHHPHSLHSDFFIEISTLTMLSFKFISTSWSCIYRTWNSHIAAEELTPTRGQLGRLMHGQKVFNYRLSRGRRIVENAFDILSQCGWVIKNGMELSPKMARRLVLCCMVLHNLMQKYFPELQDISMDGPEIDQATSSKGCGEKMLENSGMWLSTTVE